MTEGGDSFRYPDPPAAYCPQCKNDMSRNFDGRLVCRNAQCGFVLPRQGSSQLPPPVPASAVPYKPPKKVYAFDVDETLEISSGPIRMALLEELKAQGHVIGICGNYHAVYEKYPKYASLFSFIGPIAMTKDQLLQQVRTYMPADEYVMVGNIAGVTGASDDQGAAQRTGYRFIAERAFSEGAR